MVFIKVLLTTLVHFVRLTLLSCFLGKGKNIEDIFLAKQCYKNRRFLLATTQTIYFFQCILRVWIKGKFPVFHTGDMGSIPITR